MAKFKVRQLKHLEDAEYISEIDAAALRGAHRFANAILFTILALFVVFVFWAGLAKVETLVMGRGKVVPSSNVQTIQNLEGGILSGILVNEGDIVEKGQVVLKIDNSMAEADFRDTQNKYYQTMSEVARLTAEANGESAVKFPDDAIKNAPDAVAREQQLFNNRKSQLEASVAVFASQVEQKQQEIRELESRVSSLQSTFDLAKQELDINKPLADQGLVSKTDYLRLQREVNDAESQLSSTRIAIPRARSGLVEVQQRLQEARQTKLSEVQQQLNQKQGDLRSLTELITARQDRVTRTDVKSPVNGQIKEIMVTTIGGVIKPGQDIIAIVPIEDNLVIDTEVLPKDIGDIHVDQEAIIKISAYDFSIYGGLKGTVIQISPDSDENEKGEVFYRVKIKTDKNYVLFKRDPNQKKYIIPGMVAQVGIKSDEKKTILGYLFKPFLRAYSNALTEK